VQHNFQLTEEQIKIKKNWLGWTILRQVWTVLNVLAIPFMIPPNLQLDYKGFSSILIATSISVLIGLTVAYSAIYKRHSTRILNIILIVTPIFFLKDIFQHEPIPEMFRFWVFSSLMVDVGLFIWWYRLTLGLRKLHYQIKNAFPLQRID
jgi:hypothetical protein